MASALSHTLCIAVTNEHTAKLHYVGSLYILTYDARKHKHKIHLKRVNITVFCIQGKMC